MALILLRHAGQTVCNRRIITQSTLRPVCKEGFLGLL
jgi:hypothetical protein